MNREELKSLYGKSLPIIKSMLSDDGWVIVPYSKDHIQSIETAGFNRDDVEVKTIPGCHLWKPKPTIY